MQHSHISELNSEGHHALWQALKYPLLAVVVMLAAIEFSAGILITILFAAILIFALVERVKKINAQENNNNNLVFPNRLIGDGGCFPNTEPEMEQTTTGSVSVLDGGSLERISHLK